MTKLTREQVEAMLAGATPGPLYVAESRTCVFQIRLTPEPEYQQRLAEVIWWGPSQTGHKNNPTKEAARANATLFAAAPDLARELLAAWDREAKLREALEQIAGRKGAYSMPFPESHDGYGPFAVVRSREALGDTP